jgi:hypothetical protein
MKKPFVFALLLVLLMGGCEMFGCKDEGKYFEILNISLTNYKRYHISGDEYGGTYLNDNDSVKLEELRISGHYETRYYSLQKNRFSLLPQAYAAIADCPSPGRDGSKQMVAAVYIITRNDFDTHYKAGDTINDIALINDKPSAWYADNNKNGIMHTNFEISFIQKPETTNAQQFKLIYQLQGGKTFTAETKKIKIY